MLTLLCGVHETGSSAASASRSTCRAPEAPGADPVELLGVVEQGVLAALGDVVDDRLRHGQGRVDIQVCS